MSNAFDRSKYKVTKSVTEQAVNQQRAKAQENRESGNRNYHRISDDGRYLLRAFPSHNPAEDPFVRLVSRATVPYLADGKDESGNPTGKKVKFNKKVFNARVHGGAKFDIIEEYVKFIEEYAREKHPGSDKEAKEARKKVFTPINGYRARDGKWIWGITYMESYIFYASLNGKIGLVEFNKKQYDKLNVLNLQEEGDAPIGIDMLADPDDGKNFIFTKKAKEFSIDIDGFTAPKGTKPEDFATLYAKYNESQVITDEQLQELFKLEPLKEIYGTNVYRRKDFDIALEGLRLFDEEQGFKIFENEEFLKLAATLAEQYPDEATETKAEERKEAEKVVSKIMGAPKVEEEMPFDEVETDEEDENDLPFDDPEVDAAKLSKEEAEQLAQLAEQERKLALLKEKIKLGKK